ncbi:MAG TPA: hypothetical protein VK171_11530 [Fimbriimonas sp.]|nr:hypothetical protein [Fimbriimonas sp.]
MKRIIALLCLVAVLVGCGAPIADKSRENRADQDAKLQKEQDDASE